MDKKEIFDNKQRISIKLEYDRNGREVLRKFGNGTEETTLYDKAGRVTVKVQKSDCGELMWGEGYVYGSDGKRTATVDNSGRVTLFEYNTIGHLDTVYYPYSKELNEKLKEEIWENGLPIEVDIVENKYLTSSLKSELVTLMNAIVKKGDAVKAGQKIGEVGNTGKVVAGENGDGSHLHLSWDGNKDGYFDKNTKQDNPARLLYSGEQ